jgi:hypothetical protein
VNGVGGLIERHLVPVTSTVQEIGPGPSVKAIRPLSTAEEIVTIAAMQGVVVITTMELVVIVRPDKAVTSQTSLYSVYSLGTSERVAVVTTTDPVGAWTPLNLIIACTGPDDVVCGRADDVVWTLGTDNGGFSTETLRDGIRGSRDRHGRKSHGRDGHAEKHLPVQSSLHAYPLIGWPCYTVPGWARKWFARLD